MTISSPTMKNTDLSTKACPSQPLQGKPGMIWSGKRKNKLGKVS